jgi:hypothetical protein
VPSKRGSASRAVLCAVLCAVPAGSVVKAGEIWAGVPAKLLRHLSADEKGFVAASAENYARIATEHRCVGTQGKSKHELTHTHSQTLGVGCVRSLLPCWLAPAAAQGLQVLIRQARLCSRAVEVKC